jgi:hypothetical protein
LGDLSLESLGGAKRRDGGSLERLLVQAIRYYLADRDSGRAGWPYPDFVLDGDSGEEKTVRIVVDGAVWGEFSQEAARQGISTDQLLRHAALYFAADLDSGRLTQRILEGLEGEGR